MTTQSILTINHCITQRTFVRQKQASQLLDLDEEKKKTMIPSRNLSFHKNFTVFKTICMSQEKNSLLRKMKIR